MQMIAELCNAWIRYNDTAKLLYRPYFRSPRDLVSLALITARGRNVLSGQWRVNPYL